MKGKGLGVVVALFLCIFPMRAESAFRYLDINPAGWTESHAACVNGLGEVAGYGSSASGERGFLWISGTYKEIIPPGASSARAAWINSRGEVAGTAVIGGMPHAFLYSGGVYLDPAPGWAYSEAAYVAEDGSVGGTGEHGAFVSLNGAIRLMPGFTSVAGTNSAGQILGSADNAVRLFLPGTGYVTLSPPGASDAIPGGLNDAGLAAVSSRQASTEKGFVYSGGFYVFMVPPGWTSSKAMAINNGSQVTGYGLSPEGERGFLRTGASYEEIHVPGWISTRSVTVNDPGQVAGSGETASGETHAFLATPSVYAGSASPAAPFPAGESAGGGGCSVAANGPKRGGPSEWAAVALLFAPMLLPAALRAFARRPS